MQVILNRECFKIDSADAKAMIEGFYKDGKLIHQCIYCLTKGRGEFPKLITLDKHFTEFQLSDIGINLHAEDYREHFRFKYVALLEKEYSINNNPGLWHKICHNGLFDIWEPEAPYDLFDHAKTDPNKFRIALLRIYEIVKEFSKNEIEQRGARHHKLIMENLEVNLMIPVVDDKKFDEIKSLLEKSINGYIS